VLATIRVSDKTGEEYEAQVSYPSRFDLALRDLLERMVKDGLPPDPDLDATVATVAHMYRTIGGAR